MSRIATPMVRERVEIEPRRYMTPAEKVQRWNECGRMCMVCGQDIAPSGHTVIWDHRIPLALGGSNDLANMDPHHALRCAAIKTKADKRAIAKAKRLAGETGNGPKRSIPGRKLSDSPLRKRMNGKVERKLEGTLRRIRDATPSNTNSPSAARMASWTHAVAATALEDHP